MDKNNNQFELENTIHIDLKSLFMEVMDKIVLIAFSGIFVMLATYLLCSTVIELPYESTTKLYIMPQDNSGNSSYVEFEIGSLLTTDYIEMIQGRDVVEDTIENFNLPTTYEKFKKKIKVNNPTDTRIIEISVTDEDPYMARNLVMYLRDVSIDAIENGMGIDGITVWEEANLPENHKIGASLIALLLGLLVSFTVGVIVVIRYLVVDKIVTADDIEKRLGLIVLGAVAYENMGKNARRRR